MRPYYIKKNGLYLHVQTTEHEEYQDSSDINAMYTMQYVFLDDKDNAIKFLEKREADRFLVTRGRKLKGVEIKRE